MTSENFKSVRITIATYEYLRNRAFDERTSMCKLISRAVDKMPKNDKSLKNNKTK